jgi:hypothetical protein
MTVFVWTKMGVESGEKLEQIVRRKEAERVKGNGQFWWGVGNSLGPAVRDAARAQGGTLPVLFSVMLGRPKAADSSPDMVSRWTSWEDEGGRIHAIPSKTVTSFRFYGELYARHSVQQKVLPCGPGPLP